MMVLPPHPQEDLSMHPPDSEVQQQVVLSVADRDAFNWGVSVLHLLLACVASSVPWW
jgi:hypothetical protein